MIKILKQLNILKNKKTKNENGAMIIIMVAVITMMALPMLGVMYDLSMMRIAKQDVKNLQDLAGVSCVAKSGNTFDLNVCSKTVTEIAKLNSGSPSGRLKDKDFLEARRKYDNVVYCDSGESIFKDIKLDVKPVKKGYSVTIAGSSSNHTNVCYKPVFLKNSLFNAFSNNGTSNISKTFPITVAPSTFSATYKM